ncbi:MAG: adenylate/guanylate cyclase domain-containing protein, partial [Bacteroidota bacterium]
LNQIFSIADRFIPNEFIRTLGHERLTEVQLGDLVEREVSVLFTDIRSYTTLSEGMTPADTFKFINGYTHRMGPIIQDNRGFVNQYLGDGIMAIFQYSPDDALNAMIGMQVKLREYNVERKQKDRPEIAVGMGLHTGPLIMGIIGDSRRTDAATISDTVNTSARMEGLTKSFGVRILISGSSYRGLEEPDQFHFRYIGKVKVKGKNESIEVFECIDGDPQEEFDVKWELKETFDEAVALYYKNHYEESIALTEQILLQNPRDKVAQYFHRKSMEYLKK